MYWFCGVRLIARLINHWPLLFNEPWYIIIVSTHSKNAKKGHFQIFVNLWIQIYLEFVSLTLTKKLKSSLHWVWARVSVLQILTSLSTFTTGVSWSFKKWSCWASSLRDRKEDTDSLGRITFSRRVTDSEYEFKR